MTSTRPYDRLGELWDMVARSAYTQLRYSPALLAGTLAGLLWLYVLPPAAAVAGLAAAGLGGGAGAWWLAGAGIAGWALMSASYVPMLALYGLSPPRAPGLPLIALHVRRDDGRLRPPPPRRPGRGVEGPHHRAVTGGGRWRRTRWSAGRGRRARSRSRTQCSASTTAGGSGPSARPGGLSAPGPARAPG